LLPIRPAAKEGRLGFTGPLISQRPPPGTGLNGSGAWPAGSRRPDSKEISMKLRGIVITGAAALAACGALGMFPADGQAGTTAAATWTEHSPATSSRRTIRLDLVRAMRPQVLEMGLASAAELDELDTAARAHLDDPHTVVIHGLLFLTWGRKPGHAPPESPQTA
jgi:hypothetical protein